MNGKILKGQNTSYTLAGEIGKGGEGQVFELLENPGLVLKIYNDPIPADKIRKLQLMVSMSSTKIEQYAAWPTDVVKDSTGMVVGFVMRRLNGYVPLHMLFSPMDRKKIFPDKGYDFLIHACRNLATAFHTIHSLNLVMGDVNEGNILVNERGMVAFIDCDSFQIKDKSNYYFCEVGVPRYTPPELLALATFENVARTENTDNFSMAILIFQLLFLGRHPFAGINNSKEDIDEETAIKQHQFAYSATNKQKKLSPPLGSFPLRNLPNDFSTLFHRSFEMEKDRPFPAEWINHLDTLLKNMARCSQSKAHAYPSNIGHCPWCEFKENSNIVYFIDDEFIEQLSTFKNIESFINGFKIEKLVISKIDRGSASQYTLTTPENDGQYRYLKWYHRFTLAIVILIGIYLIQFGGYYFVLSIIATLILHNTLPWRKRLRSELKQRELDYADKKRKLDTAYKEYEAPSELRTYDSKGAQLNSLILEFKNLPSEFQNSKSAIESRLYDQQLQAYLSNFDIRDYKIPNFGASRKLTLYGAGIKNAGDVDKLKTIRIQGFGPKFIQILFSWQRQMSSRFLYRPDQSAMKKAYDTLSIQIEQKKSKLEIQIKSEYQNLNYLKANICSRKVQLHKYIDQLQREFYQSEINLAHFKNVVG